MPTRQITEMSKNQDFSHNILYEKPIVCTISRGVGQTHTAVKIIKRTESLKSLKIFLRNINVSILAGLTVSLLVKVIKR